MTDPNCTQTYILTIAHTGAEFRATVYHADHVEVDGGVVIEARAGFETPAACALGDGAWQAGADALAAAMPDPS